MQRKKSREEYLELIHKLNNILNEDFNSASEYIMKKQIP